MNRAGRRGESCGNQWFTNDTNTNDVYGNDPVLVMITCDGYSAIFGGHEYYEYDPPDGNDINDIIIDYPESNGPLPPPLDPILELLRVERAQRDALIKDIKRRLTKAENARGQFAKCKVVRPLYLLLLRKFSMMMSSNMPGFVLAAHRKAGEILGTIGELEFTADQVRYINLLRKALRRYREGCIRNTLECIGNVPSHFVRGGDRVHIPLELRCHIAGYLNLVAPMRF